MVGVAANSGSCNILLATGTSRMEKNMEAAVLFGIRYRRPLFNSSINNQYVTCHRLLPSGSPSGRFLKLQVEETATADAEVMRFRSRMQQALDETLTLFFCGLVDRFSLSHFRIVVRGVSANEHGVTVRQINPEKLFFLITPRASLEVPYASSREYAVQCMNSWRRPFRRACCQWS